MKNDYLQVMIEAIRQNGYKMQTMVAIEEMSELTKELVKFMRGEHNTDAIAEEIADVEIMLCQLKIIYDIKDEDVEKLMVIKLERLKERLEGRKNG